MNKLDIFYRHNNHGFTLIELIVTIIILGIMAVTVVPKFLTSQGFAEYSYRDELIGKLRAIQLRAMQQTSDVACQSIRVSTSEVGLLATTKVGSTVSCSGTTAGDTTRVIIASGDNISFSASENLSSFRFSSLGRPLDCVAKTPCDITLTVTGDETLNVFINSEGYIYVP